MKIEKSMNESSESKRGLNRRDALKGMTAVSLALATGACGCTIISIRFPVQMAVVAQSARNGSALRTGLHEVAY